jgi:ribosome biogenesis GTPase
MQLWRSDQGIDDTFAEITELADNCHFADCTHRHEKGCAVLAAVESGRISSRRYKNYLKLLKEAEYLEEKGDQQSFLASKRKEKELHRAMKRYRKGDYLKK